MYVCDFAAQQMAKAAAEARVQELLSTKRSQIAKGGKKGRKPGHKSSKNWRHSHPLLVNDIIILLYKITQIHHYKIVKGML